MLLGSRTVPVLLYLCYCTCVTVPVLLCRKFYVKLARNRNRTSAIERPATNRLSNGTPEITHTV